jgi:ComEC/Rec2-related protein
VTQPAADADETPPLPPASPDLRLLPAALAAWGAAWWATTRSAGVVLAVAGLAALLAGLTLVVPRRATATGEHPSAASPATSGTGEWARRTASVLAVAFAAVAVVLAACAVRLDGRAAGALPEWAEDRAVATVVGRITGDAHAVQTRMREGSRWAVRVRPTEVSARGHIQRDVHGPLLVLGDARWSSVVAGSSVRLTGRLLPPRRGDPTIAAIVAQTAPVTVDRGAWPWRTAERLRVGLRAACTGLPTDAAGLLPALVVGDTSALPEELRDDLRAAGLTHLTAVSGANCAIVAATAGGLLALAGAGRRGRVAGTVLAIAGFVVLARPEPSVLRAAVMGGVALVGILLARREVALAALCTATVALLTVDPWLSRSFGFVLSVLATGALILLVPVWVDRWPLPRLAATALAVPLAAQAATAPVVVLLQPSVSLVGIPANVLAAPAVAPATVGGVVAAALSPLWPTGAHLVALAAGLPTAWIAYVAHVGSGLPGGSLPWLPGRLGALLLALMVTGAVLASARSRRPADNSDTESAANAEPDVSDVAATVTRAPNSGPGGLSSLIGGHGADAGVGNLASEGRARDLRSVGSIGDVDPDARVGGHGPGARGADLGSDGRARGVRSSGRIGDIDAVDRVGGLGSGDRVGGLRSDGRARDVPSAGPIGLHLVPVGLVGGLGFVGWRTRRLAPRGPHDPPPGVRALRVRRALDTPRRLSLGRPAPGPHTPRGPALRPGDHLRHPLPWAVGLLAVVVLLGWVLGPRLFGGDRGAAAAWSVVQCDVGQGDAVLLRTGDHRAMLVDAGPDPDVADRCLRHWGVDALDLVVVTHFHADHVGGLSGALRGRGRPPIVTSPCHRPAGGYRSMADAAHAAGSTVTAGRAGASGRLGDPRWPIAWHVLWPPADSAGCVATPTGDEDEAANDSSVVLSADVQGIHVLALGDLETDAQRSLAAAVDAAEPVDVVKVAHHGSTKQHPALYAKVRPRVALIGVGRGNDYGHPTSSTLGMLEALGVRILRTDEQGDVAVIGPASRLAALTARRRRPATRVRSAQRAPPRGYGRCHRLVGGCLRGSVR